MKLKKVLITISTLLISCALLVGCKAKDNLLDNEIPIEVEKETTIKLDFLVVPEQIIAFNKGQIEKMDELKDEDQYENTEELTDILNSGKVIENKIIINMAFNKITELEGDVVESVDMDNAIARFVLNEDKKAAYYDSTADLDSYSKEITLLEDDHIIIPLFTTDGQVEYLKAKLPKELMSKFKKLLIK